MLCKIDKLHTDFIKKDNVMLSVRLFSAIVICFYMINQ